MNYHFQNNTLKVLNLYNSQWEEKEIFEIEPNIYYFFDRLDWLIIENNFIRTDHIGLYYHPELIDKIPILEIILGRGIMTYYQVNERECVIEPRRT